MRRFVSLLFANLAVISVASTALEPVDPLPPSSDAMLQQTEALSDEYRISSQSKLNYTRRAIVGFSLIAASAAVAFGLFRYVKALRSKKTSGGASGSVSLEMQIEHLFTLQKLLPAPPNFDVAGKG